ncbi:phycocyanin alpha phycocyanobilin lyase [Nostoc sp. CENA543]|uniref:HEAT repeat domain-containing protein n=1 Tax=Nostoc sp. CENA543 TaxID=1869241 RepID=UPI000CA2902E|nr:HEAT repeat domain-containing protein [Nostoc sp. CENA543]AUT01726.1 phycocyanin alpha phycocyanobilin lyase [Nostoc sp. CENA543]
MNQHSLEQIAAQLNSSNVSDRILAMIELQKETMPAQDAYPLIKQAIYDENVQVRGMAAFSLGVKQTPENRAILVNVLEADPDYNVRAMAAGALGYLEDQQALAPLTHAFYEDTSWLVQFSAAVALGNLKNVQAQAVLLEALNSKNPLLQEAAIMALGEIGAISVIDRLLQYVNADDWMLRKRLAEALGNLPVPQSQAALNDLQQDSNPLVVEAAVRSQQKLAKLL